MSTTPSPRRQLFEVVTVGLPFSGASRPKSNDDSTAWRCAKQLNSHLFEVGIIHTFIGRRPMNSTFKLVVGQHLIAATPLGWGLLALGGVDLVMNVGNAVGLAVRGRPFGPLCLLHGLARRLGPASSSSTSERQGELGLAVDMALAFVLVAGMIAAGRIGLLSATALSWWNGAVILNVLGAGALRLVDAARAARA
jgi:hypothetical protein